MKAEVMWSIVLSNYSLNSVSKKSDIFCKMFPDSKHCKSVCVCVCVCMCVCVCVCVYVYTISPAGFFRLQDV